MKASKSDQILEARMAFDAGDMRRGSSILHAILNADITYGPAWKLLHGALNRSETLAEFQLDFVSKYYPDKLAQFRAETEGTPADSGKNGPYRRVSLFSQPALDPEPKPIPINEERRPDTGTEPVSRRIAPESASGIVPEPKTGSDGPEKERKGLFARMGAFLSRVTRRKSRAKTPPEAASTADKGEFLPESDSKYAPISLKDLPTKKVVETPQEARRRKESARPLLAKLHEEQFEIRLLIADDIQQTRENIRKLLKFEPSVEVVGVAANGEQAIALALEHAPDIVLMDINMPGMDGLQALKTIREKLPMTQVIMLTVQDDPGYLREALQSGARDYLIKPPTIDELLQTIQKTYEIGKIERERLTRLNAPPVDTVEDEIADVNGFVVAVYSPKGGVGCTLLASNLAVAAHTGERAVVLVDCDLQYGSVGLFFNEQARSTIVDLAPRINDPDRALLRDAIVTHPDSGVNLILAPPRPEHAERVHGSHLVDLIRYLRRVYPIVVIDTGSSLDDRMADVLISSDQVLVVMTQDIPAINEVRQLLDFAPHIGLDEAKISLVLNQYHKRINITEEQISKNLRRPFAAIVPLDNRTAIPSINRGIPFMLKPEYRSLPIGVAVQSLLEQVLDRQLVAV